MDRDKNPVVDSDLMTLIHHVELNKIGWHLKMIRRVILLELFHAKTSLLLSELTVNVKNYLKLPLLTTDSIREQIEILISDNQVMSINEEKYKISENEKAIFGQQRNDSQMVCDGARSRFLNVMSEHTNDLNKDQVWDWFLEKFLFPMLKANGAKVFEFISGEEAGATFNDLGDFLQLFPADQRAGITFAIDKFFDPDDGNLRTFILGYLNVFFLLSSSTITDDVLDMLESTKDDKTEFVLFVDTNFLFSILGLHDNPSNDTSLMLQELVAKVKNRIDVKFYVLPPTVEETRSRLVYDKAQFGNLRVAPNVAIALEKAKLHGAYKKFTEEAKKKNSVVDAKLLLDPYIKSLVTILRSKGIELYNRKLDEYGTDQRVMDDIVSQLEWQKSVNHKYPRSYEALKHDYVIWHGVNDLRQESVDSAIQAKYWIVTIDGRFISYDLHKKKTLSNSLPICLHPTAFIQMFQFWLPRSEELERAVMSSIRLPLFFEPFDSEAEKITLRILQVLGHYENISDLSSDTVRSVLLNEVLRNKILNEESEESRIELINETIIEENKKIRAELSIRDKTINVLRENDAVSAGKIKALEIKLSDNSKTLLETKNQISAIEKIQNDDRKTKEIKSVRSHYCIKTSSYVLVSSIIIFSLIDIMDNSIIVINSLQKYGMTIGMSLFVSLYIIEYLGKRTGEILSWIYFIKLCAFKKWLKRIIGLIVLGLVSSVAWKYFEPFLP